MLLACPRSIFLPTRRPVWLPLLLTKQHQQLPPCKAGFGFPCRTCRKRRHASSFASVGCDPPAATAPTPAPERWSHEVCSGFWQLAKPETMAAVLEQDAGMWQGHAVGLQQGPRVEARGAPSRTLVPSRSAFWSVLKFCDCPCSAGVDSLPYKSSAPSSTPIKMPSEAGPGAGAAAAASAAASSGAPACVAPDATCSLRLRVAACTCRELERGGAVATKRPIQGLQALGVTARTAHDVKQRTWQPASRPPTRPAGGRGGSYGTVGCCWAGRPTDECKEG